MKDVQYRNEAPDGGWGWFVVLSSFLCHVLTIGIAKSFGVFFPYFLEGFGEDASSTAWVSSIQGSSTLFASVFAGVLSNVFGCRTVVMTGSLVATTGLISGAFVTSLPAMYLTTGLVTGVGFSFMYTPCLTMVGRYFKKRRALANGLGVAGTGLGTFILPPFFQYVIDSYGWRGSLLLTAGVALQGLVSGALLRPIYLKEDIETNDANALQAKSVCSTRLLDFSLFKTPLFVIFTFANIFLFFGNFIPYVHLVAHARHVGIDAQSAAFLISIIGIGDGLARITYGWLSDLGLFVRMRGYIVCLLGSAVSLVCIPAAHTYPAMVACCLCFGMFAGSYTTQTAVFLAEFCGVNRLASALGILHSIGGFPTLFGPPIAGYLYDVTGNYDVSFYVAGSAVFFSVLLMTSVEVHRTRTEHTKKKKITSNGQLLDASCKDKEVPQGFNDDVTDCDNVPFVIRETTV